MLDKETEELFIKRLRRYIDMTVETDLQLICRVISMGILLFLNEHYKHERHKTNDRR